MTPKKQNIKCDKVIQIFSRTTVIAIIAIKGPCLGKTNLISFFFALLFKNIPQVSIATKQ